MIPVMGLIVSALVSGAALSSHGRAEGADGHEYYLTFDHATIPEFSAPWMLVPGSNAAVIYARQAPECRPSELDPEGNWGFITERMQLGLRLNGSVFTNGQEIIATFFVRNTGKSNACYLSYRTSLSRSFKLTIVREGGRDALLTLDQEAGRTNTVMNSFPATASQVGSGVQRRMPIPIGRIFNLTRPGKYFISGMVRCYHGVPFVIPPESRINVAVSGTAMFEVVAAPGGQAGVDTNATPAGRTREGFRPMDVVSAAVVSQIGGTSSPSVQKESPALSAARPDRAGQPRDNGAFAEESAKEEAAGINSRPKGMIYAGVICGLLLFGLLGLLYLRWRRS